MGFLDRFTWGYSCDILDVGSMYIPGGGQVMRPPGLDAYLRSIIVPRIGGIYLYCHGEGYLPTLCLPGTPAVLCVSHVAVLACSMYTGSIHGHTLGCGAGIQDPGPRLDTQISDI